MKKLMLIAVLMIMPMTVFADYFQVTVIDQCNGQDRIAAYKFRSLKRARDYRNIARKQKDVKATWIKKIKQ